MQNNLKTIIVIALISICQNLNLRAAQWHEKPGDQKPILFDVNDSVIPNDNIPLIKPWKTVVLDKKYRGGWIVAGDVDNDGQVDIVTARIGDFKGAADRRYSAVGAMDEHYTASVAAHRLDGSVIWKWGNPSEGRNQLFHDVACQIYDWDGDGLQSIIIGQSKSMFDGQGKKIAVFDMPTPPGETPPSSTEESILCATGDMTGNGINDVIYYTNPGTVVCIYKNQSALKPKQKTPLGMGVNYTLY